MTGLFSLMSVSSLSLLLEIYMPMPPSTGRPAPVMKRASLEQRKTAASAMSPTSPKRRLPDDRGHGGASVRREAHGDNVVGQLHAHVGGNEPGIETIDAHAVA